MRGGADRDVNGVIELTRDMFPDRSEMRAPTPEVDDGELVLKAEYVPR